MTTLSHSFLVLIGAAGFWGLGSWKLSSNNICFAGVPAQENQTQELPSEDGGQGQDQEARTQLVQAMAQAGIHMDLESGIVSIPATVQMRTDLLEYALCTPRGQSHESLFLTEVSPTALNAALLALGLEKGQNARLVAGAEVLTEGQVQEGGGPGAGELTAAAAASAPEVIPPTGDALFLYVGWREQSELYFYRLDDLIANLDQGRTLKRHAWVYLGSRLVQPRRSTDGSPSAAVFAAELEGNLINISFFFGGNTLLTAARPECIGQTVWVGNEWLLPPTSSPVEFFFSRQLLESVPVGWRGTLPVVKSTAVTGESGR